MLEKLQQYIADKDGEGTETRVKLLEIVPPAEGFTTGEELPEEFVDDRRRRLQAEIDRELRA
jgi:hypothetical protein